ncbi:hypothetical protein [Janthinobacterium psychrotolerans]|uniref:DUF2884 family protein n=1 Tax=Janthinobacterium psychrotolerans TaxID=1747903 RepID=A0A1A7C213_9BURK|nr:hypothetical protein [Janthinobacterium psychrotolerans]OBV39049.1 hypothetical protein ASR47_1008110 [Janthinobacterium psychrotolerans]
MMTVSRLCLALAGAILSVSAIAAAGEPFTLVQGKNGAISTYGSGSDNEELDRLKRSSHGAFLWFRDHGKSYVIDDHALLARAGAAWKPVQALGQEMSALGSQMGEQGRHMGKLGREMGEQGHRGHAGQAAMDVKARQMDQAAKPMDSLGKRMGELGERQGRASKEAERATRVVIDEALRTGKAKPLHAG